MKKKIPKKITLDNLEKTAIKYLEKYSATEFQLKNILKRKIIKSSFFKKNNPKENFDFIEVITKKLKKIGIINDKKFSENKVSIYLERGYSKKKIIFNLRGKGISDENIKHGIKSLETIYSNSELTSAIIFAKKKKIINFKKEQDQFKEKQKKLLKMAQAGFSYDICKKILDLKDEGELLKLEESLRKESN